MWRKLIARYLLLARAILPLLRHTRGAARGRRKSPRRLLGLGSAAFSPFYCDKNPDGERPAFWKTGFEAVTRCIGPIYTRQPPEETTCIYSRSS